ncbi:MAG: diaminopimelate decarboxylase [Thermodesulfovibrionia bacterium]|nr:diaminopimelate decarboxylase [Thermodesulfovibrionia bacterium]
MHDFIYKNSELYAEEVPVREIAEKVGTPLYIYSHKTLLKHYNAFDEAFDGYPHIICFALKANSNLALLKLLAREGSGSDVVSGGELFLALKAGIPAKKIVYAGVGKTKEEIIYALKSRILMFNVESPDELMTIDKIAGELGVKAPIALRVNPDISASTHPYISTGLKKHKFGIPINKALEYYSLASKLNNVKILGIHKHIGSQITKVSPFVEALKKVLVLAQDLKSQGIEIKYLDIGGGLGISYDEEVAPHPKSLARAIIPLVSSHNFTLIIEPGRSIAGNAGILITKVLYLKKHLKKEFVIVDAGMNDLIRPSLYEAYHHILPVTRKNRPKVIADVVGPICESGDFFAKGRKMGRPRHDELLAIMSAGAYGFSMSSNYNSRTRAAEVLVKGKDFSVIRERETYKDLIKGEKIPAFLK